MYPLGAFLLGNVPLVFKHVGAGVKGFRRMRTLAIRVLFME